jgi:hypothetical protein
MQPAMIAAQGAVGKGIPRLALQVRKHNSSFLRCMDLGFRQRRWTQLSTHCPLQATKAVEQAPAIPKWIFKIDSENFNLETENLKGATTPSPESTAPAKQKGVRSLRC